MEKFTCFLREAKESIDDLDSFEKIHIVIGNESCDLDSTISALALSYLKKSQDAKTLVLPLFNVKAEQFVLRTEICFLLNKCEIDRNHLIFINEVDLSNILSKNKQVTTSLVDHHVLPDNIKMLGETVHEIFDHRPVNEQEICKNTLMKSVIKTVGSCATLIATEIFDTKSDILFKELAYLLYATIIYDTIGLNPEAGRTFTEDLTVAARLEEILQLDQNRRALFDVLWKVHNDTSTLTTKDLLYRDLKIVCGIPVPGLPLLVEHYLEREEACDAIKAFAEEFKSDVAVIIGIDAGQDVKRDLAIYFNNEKSKSIIVETLKSRGSDLLLAQREIKNCNSSVICFKQNNVKLTRKFIIPLVEYAAKQYNIS